MENTFIPKGCLVSGTIALPLSASKEGTKYFDSSALFVLGLQPFFVDKDREK
jgi:hypothetical protein